MIKRPPFVVVVTGPSAGVGKSTLASNIAVYLKALSEDLVVGFCSLDQQVNADAMFSLVAPSERSFAEIQSGTPLEEVLTLGQYGVEYCAAVSTDFMPQNPQELRIELAKADFDGVLILDVGPTSSCWQSAIWAADLLLVPIKDPQSLSELGRIRRELQASEGEVNQLLVLPSQLGVEIHLQQQVDLQDFLRFAADERGYQVLEQEMPSDPLVHEQAAKIDRSVITRLPQSRTHQQLRQLAGLILDRWQQSFSHDVRVRRWLVDGMLSSRVGRVDWHCPLCSRPVSNGNAHYLESFPGRNRHLLHENCVAVLLDGTCAPDFHGNSAVQLIRSGAANSGQAGELLLQIFTEDGELLCGETLVPETDSGWAGLLKKTINRRLVEMYDELLLLSSPEQLETLLSNRWYADFVTCRKQLRQICLEEKL